ncbi:uncharacterized protein LOC128929307 [Callithrix jacchus]
MSTLLKPFPHLRPHICAVTHLHPSPLPGQFNPSPAKVDWIARPASGAEKLPFSNSNNGGQGTALNAGSGWGFGAPPESPARSRCGLSSGSRKKLSNMEAGLETRAANGRRQSRLPTSSARQANGRFLAAVIKYHTVDWDADL